jgi:hypothetical protein
MAYTLNGVRYNDDGTPAGKAGVADYAATSPFDGPLTAADIERQQKAAMGEYWGAAGIGAGLGAAQLGLSFIDTAADKTNKEELAKLQERSKRGELGLTAGERQQYERALLDPVRAIAGQQQREEESAIASAGRVTSAADITRARREGRSRLDQASIAASENIQRAHSAEAQREAQELSERLATEANRERERISMVGQTISGLAANIGKVAAAGARKASVTDGQVMQMMGARDARGNPVYPGLKGLSLSGARAIIEAGDTNRLFGQVASSVPGGG